MAHKAAFITIIGKPNVGKSTLLNLLLGEKLCIVTNKAQTTRHRILGMLNTPEYQLVFSDTPGIIEDQSYHLHKKMMEAVKGAIQDADVFLYLVEAGMKAVIEEVPPAILHATVPMFLIINKIDTIEQAQLEAQVAAWQEILPTAIICPISALHKFNHELLLAKIIDLAPIHPPYYEKEAFTDRSERFFVSEIIREKILLNYKQEIPYSCEVVITAFRENETPIQIDAEIHVARETQKGILIGHRGNAISQLLKDSKKGIEAFLQQAIFLNLVVKVKDNWRNDLEYLKRREY